MPKVLSGRRFLAVLPFGLVGVAGVLTLLLPPHNQHMRFVTGLACGIWVVVALAWMARLPDQHRLLSVPLVGLFVALTVVRDLTGGASSGLAPLIYLPVLWVVLHGTRGQLWLAGACTASAFIVPLLLVGPPKYDASDWRRGVLWSLLVVVVCPVLQRGLGMLRSSAREQTELAGQLSSVLRAATEHSIIATDLEGTITTFSQGAERMLGRRAVDVVGKASPMVFHDPAEVAERAAELGMEPGLGALVNDVPADGVGDRHWTYRRGDGSTLRVRLTITRLLTQGGGHIGWIYIARDITEQDRTQLGLVTAERRWRALLDHLPETTVMVVGPDMEYRVAMGHGLAERGLEDGQGQTLYGTSSPANIAILEPLYRAALAGAAGSCELTSTANVGVTFEVDVTPLPDHEGVAEAMVVARDVTKDRQRETDLRVARDRFERLFEEAPHGTMLMDTAGNVSRVNPAFCSMMGLPAAALTGRPVSALPFMSGEQPSQLRDVLSGTSSRVKVERTLRPGAADELHVAVTGVALRDADGEFESLLVTVMDVSERFRHETELAHLAEHDPLTGLCNRRKFNAELSAHLARTNRYGAQGALLMLDLDGFKQVNDILGHAAGDEILVKVADVLNARTRDSDVVGRLGGDEFAVLLPNVQREGAQKVAGDLVRLIRDQATVLHGALRLTVTASIGVVLIRDGQTTAGDLLGSADLMMYDAKQGGRDRYCILH